MPFRMLRICLILQKGRDDENTSEEGLQLRSIEASRVFGYLKGLKKQKLDFKATKIGKRQGAQISNRSEEQINKPNPIFSVIEASAKVLS